MDEPNVNEPITNENSEQFEFFFDRLQPSEIDDSQYEFIHDFKNKAKSYGLFTILRSFLETWANSINSMEINTKDKVKVFNLAGNLVEELNNINIKILDDPENDLAPVHILNTTNNLVHSELNLYETAYKFNKKVRSNSAYVHPEERVIGTRIEMKRCSKSNIAIPRMIQSTFQFVPITKTPIAVSE